MHKGVAHPEAKVSNASNPHKPAFAFCVPDGLVLYSFAMFVSLYMEY